MKDGHPGTIAVTGATGAIGLALIRLCIEQGIRAYVFVREDSARISRIPEDPLVKVIYCSLDEMASFDAEAFFRENDLPAADVFFHMAWMNAFGAEARNDLRTQIKNLDYAIDAADLAKRLGCRLFIGAGSQAEYGRADSALTPDTPCHPENGYGMAKLAAGQMTRLQCEKLGMDHIWTRILSVYGPGDGEGTLVMSIIRDVLEGKNPECTKGEQIWDYIYSRDAARALLLLAEKGVSGRTYLIASGSAGPLRDHIERICAVCAEEGGVRRADPVYGARPYGDRQVMHLEADISSLTEDTGFVPETSFEEGIRETVRWMLMRT